MSDSTEEKKTRRQGQAEARREQLLAVALELFAERGIRGATIKEIAQAAGITEGLIYHYFPSKAALVQTVLENRQIEREMTTLIGELKGVPAREAYFRIGSRLLELLSRNRKFIVMVVTEAQRDPEIAQVLGGLMARGFQVGRQFVEERIAAGELRPHDPADSIRLLHGSLFWYFLIQERVTPAMPAPDRESFVRGVVDVFLHGVLP